MAFAMTDKKVELGCGAAPALNKGWIYRDQVQKTADGWTVLDFYVRRYPHSSRQQWRQRLVMGLIEIDGVPAAAETRLKPGQQLAYHRPPWREPAAPRQFQLLWADRDLLIVNKPAGLQVLPGGSFLQNTLLNLLREAYPEDRNLTPVHRLGRGTSGLMAIARSRPARQRLSRDWRQGRVQKIYRALAQNADMAAAFVVETAIGKVAYAPLGHVYAASPSGKPARSLCRVLERRCDAHCTLMEVAIPTGRPHQIRIHLAAAGYPLVGDPLYAKGGCPKSIEAHNTAAVPGDGGYALHAHRLAFDHPQTGVPQLFVCAPPAVLRTQKEVDERKKIESR